MDESRRKIGSSSGQVLGSTSTIPLPRRSDAQFVNEWFQLRRDWENEHECVWQ